MSTTISTPTRTSPYLAKIIDRYPLNSDTWHVSLSVPGLDFKPGDSIGIFPQNGPAEVEEILSHLSDDSLRDRLLYKSNLLKIRGSKTDLLTFVQENPGETIEDRLLPMMPRFYSIASSQSAHPDEVHLLVATFTYEHCGKTRSGLGSSFLTETNELVPLYVQPNDKFRFKDNAILIGPGTGVAPYRAFMQENPDAKAWLFFGECHESTDFYYQNEWATYPNLQVTTAFSRDQAEKVYVQRRILEHADAIWSWLQSGATIYICGDAKKMARDVQATFCTILEEKGVDAPLQMIRTWRKEGRYLTDIY